MTPFLTRSAVAADTAAVAAIVAALESSFYGETLFSEADLRAEWERLDLARDAHVVLDGERIVGYGAVQEAGERCHVEGCVHPDAHGRGVGTMIVTALEAEAARRGGRRIRNSVLEADTAARTLLESLGYAAVRVFREMRIDVEAPRRTLLHLVPTPQRCNAAEIAPRSRGPRGRPGSLLPP